MPSAKEREHEIVRELNLFDVHTNVKSVCICFQEEVTSAHVISLLVRAPRLNHQLAVILKSALNTSEDDLLKHFYGVTEYQHALLVNLIRDINQSLH